MRRSPSIFTLLSVLPVSLFGCFDGFKTDSRAPPSKKGKAREGPCLFSHPPPFEKGGRKLLIAAA
jgi:hypothetical protein